VLSGDRRLLVLNDSTNAVDAMVLEYRKRRDLFVNRLNQIPGFRCLSPDGAFYAWRNDCPHQGGPVCQGRLMKRVIEPVADDGTTRTLEYDAAETNIVCPWHGYEFSVKTGFHQGSQRFRLRKAEFSIREGDIYVRT